MCVCGGEQNDRVQVVGTTKLWVELGARTELCADGRVLQPVQEQRTILAQYLQRNTAALRVSARPGRLHRKCHESSEMVCVCHQYSVVCLCEGGWGTRSLPAVALEYVRTIPVPFGP